MDIAKKYTELQKSLARVDKAYCDRVMSARTERDNFRNDLAKELGVKPTMVPSYIQGKTMLKAWQVAGVVRVYNKYGIPIPKEESDRE